MPCLPSFSLWWLLFQLHISKSNKSQITHYWMYLIYHLKKIQKISLVAQNITILTNISDIRVSSTHRLWTQTNGLFTFFCWHWYKQPLPHKLKIIFFTFTGECWMTAWLTICGANKLNKMWLSNMNIFMSVMSFFPS